MMDNSLPVTLNPNNPLSPKWFFAITGRRKVNHEESATRSGDIIMNLTMLFSVGMWKVLELGAIKEVGCCCQSSGDYKTEELRTA